MSSSTRSLNSRTTLVSATFLLTLFAFAVFNIYCNFLHQPDLTWLNYDHAFESLLEATRVPKVISSEAPDVPTNVHTFQNDGDVIVGIDAPRHPVFDLTKHAIEEWELLLAAQGGDQTQAVLQYHLQRSRKNSPASRASIFSLDLFTPIHSSLLSSRQREAEILPNTFTLVISSGVPTIIYGNLTTVSAEHRTRRVGLLLDAIRPFSNTLPDLRATFNVLPHPRHPLHSQAIEVLHALSDDRSLPNSPVKFRSQAEPSGKKGEHGRPIHADDLKLIESPMTRGEHWSWKNACYAQLDIEGEPKQENAKSGSTPPIRFVASPEERSDPCLHRSLTEAEISYESTHTGYHTRISPIISETTAPWASDVLLPPLDFFDSDYQDDVHTIPWDNKTAGLFWRGPGADIAASYPMAQAQRLLDFTKSEEQGIIIPNDEEGFLIDRKRLTDVITFNFQQGGSGGLEEEARQKFVVELGGGAQMRRKMASGSLVFRPLLLGDWVSEHSVPWVHYVPVQPDLSDLPSLTVFFERHDAIAQRIANAGMALAREQLNQERVRDELKQVLERWGRLGLGLVE